MTDLIDRFLSELQGNFYFRDQPVTLPSDLRPSYRLSLIVLMLQICGRGGVASLLKLNVINWWMQSPESRIQAQEILSGDRPFSEATLRFEPSFARAIDFSSAEGLTEMRNGRQLALTEKGKNLAKDLIKEAVLEREKAFLNLVGKRLTEQILRAKHPEF